MSYEDVDRVLLKEVLVARVVMVGSKRYLYADPNSVADLIIKGFGPSTNEYDFISKPLELQRSSHPAPGTSVYIGESSNVTLSTRSYLNSRCGEDNWRLVCLVPQDETSNNREIYQLFLKEG